MTPPNRLSDAPPDVDTTGSVVAGSDTAQRADMQCQLDELRRELRTLRQERRVHGSVVLGLACILCACIARSQSPAPNAPTVSFPPARSTSMQPSSAIHPKRPVPVLRPSEELLNNARVSMPTVSSPQTPITTPSPEVVCSALKVVDENGRVLAMLGGARRGGFLSLRGRDAVQYAAMSIGENGGLYELNGRDGQVRLFNGVDHNGGLTRWIGNAGQVGARMAVAQRGGDLALSGSQRARFAAGVGVNDSGLVEILGSDGKARARIGVLNGSGAIVVLDAKGRILAALP